MVIQNKVEKRSRKQPVDEGCKLCSLIWSNNIMLRLNAHTFISFSKILKSQIYSSFATFNFINTYIWIIYTEHLIKSNNIYLLWRQLRVSQALKLKLCQYK